MQIKNSGKVESNESSVAQVSIDIPTTAASSDLRAFSEATCSAIGWYVYALTDASGRAFYVGKGRRNRVFDHVNEVRALIVSDPTGLLARLEEEPDAEIEQPLGPKFRQIADILKAKREPGMFVIREGLTEELALAIEAAVISVLEWQWPGRLTNQVAGHGTAAVGLKSVAELEATKGESFKLASLPEYAEIVGREVAVINVNRRWAEVLSGRASLLEISKGHWRMSLARAEKCPYAIVHSNGIVRGVFRTLRWESSPTINGRVIFVAENDAPLEGHQFSSKNAASLFEPAGARSQNPIRYLRVG